MSTSSITQQQDQQSTESLATSLDIAHQYPSKEQILLRQAKEQQLYDKWLAAKQAADDNRKSRVQDNNQDELLPAAIDARTRAILFKLKTQDHFGLRLVRRVSSNERATVFFATGENDMSFAFTIFHSGKQTAKKEFGRLLELEKQGDSTSPSPILFRGHVLVTKWIETCEQSQHQEEGHVEAEESSRLRRRDLSPASKKAQKKATKEAQAENRRNAHLKELHLTGISERKNISRRLYNKKRETEDTRPPPVF